MRQLEWLDGPTGGRTRTRQTPRQAIWAKRMAEYEQGVLEAQEKVTDPLAMIDEILVGKAISGRITDVDATNKEVRPGNKRATLVPVVTLDCDRDCLVPEGRDAVVDRGLRPHPGRASTRSIAMTTARRPSRSR